MIGSWQFEQSCSRNVLGEKPSTFHVDERISRAVDDQGRHVDRGQNIADVNLAQHPDDCGSCRRARAKSLVSPPPLLQGQVLHTRRREHRQIVAAAPGFFDISEESAPVPRAVVQEARAKPP